MLLNYTYNSCYTLHFLPPKITPHVNMFYHSNTTTVTPSGHYFSPRFMNVCKGYFNEMDQKIVTGVGITTSGYFLIQKGVKITCCKARRRVRTEIEDENNEEFGYNEEIRILEFYTQSNREEALLVGALVDDQQVEVLIFKGYSSCLSYETSPDPSESVLPQRAVIKTIDRVRGPFDPTNIVYIEKGLTWESFRSRISTL